MVPTSREEFTPWAPLVPIGDTASMAQPQVPALVAFWRRVREDILTVRPESRERLDKHARSSSALTDELHAVLSKPLSIPMLQELHVLATRDQTAARVILHDGSFRYVPFPYGKLKDKPNHLSVGGKVVCEFCPPERVVAELEVLLAEHERLPESMVDVRSAWLVHAFLQVHPFVDGNGRVSRLLANWNLIRAGLPPVWGESTERGSGWADALEVAAKTNDLAPVTRLLAGHQERLVSRLLLLAESPQPDTTIEQVLAHGATLGVLRAKWSDHAAGMRERIAGLVTIAQAGLQQVEAQLGDRLEVVVETGATEKLWRQATESGVTADRHEPGALITLTARSPRTRIQIGLAALGTSGSGAWTAFVRVRPRSTLPIQVPPLMMLPEESDAARTARFELWLDRALTDAVGSWIRIA